MYYCHPVISIQLMTVVSLQSSGLLIKQTHIFFVYIYCKICRYFIYHLMNWYLLKWPKYQFINGTLIMDLTKAKMKRNWTISHSIIFAFAFSECVCSLRMHLHWVKMNATAIFFDVCRYSAWIFDKLIRRNNKKIAGITIKML